MKLFESLRISSLVLYKMLAKDPRVLETEALMMFKLFRDHAFDEKQIASLTTKRPTLYLFNAQKNIEPKLKYFSSLGFSDVEIAHMCSTEPYILERSLEKQIIPCVTELKRILGTDENVLKAMRACCCILEYDVEEMLEPKCSPFFSFENVNASTEMLVFRSRKTSEVFPELMELGLNPNKFVFVLAVSTMAVISDALWEQKVEVYRSYGLSTEEIYSAFKSQPLLMSVSEKITKLMSFSINKLKMKPSTIAGNPKIVLLSLENRIIPRCSVLQILTSKGLTKGEVSLIHSLRMS